MATYKIDYIALAYKIFLGVLLIGQIYSLYFDITDIFTQTISIVLSLYLAFRIYLLIRLKNRAKKASMTLSEYIDFRRTCCEKYYMFNDDVKDEC